MIRRPPRSTQSRSSAASDVYKRQRLPRAPTVGIIPGGLLRRKYFWTLELRSAGGVGTAKCRRRPNPGIARLAGRRHLTARGQPQLTVHAGGRLLAEAKAV